MKTFEGEEKREKKESIAVMGKRRREAIGTERNLEKKHDFSMEEKSFSFLRTWETGGKDICLPSTKVR